MSRNKLQKEFKELRLEICTKEEFSCLINADISKIRSLIDNNKHDNYKTRSSLGIITIDSDIEYKRTLLRKLTEAKSKNDQHVIILKNRLAIYEETNSHKDQPKEEVNQLKQLNNNLTTENSRLKNKLKEIEVKISENEKEIFSLKQSMKRKKENVGGKETLKERELNKNKKKSLDANKSMLSKWAKNLLPKRKKIT